MIQGITFNPRLDKNGQPIFEILIDYSQISPSQTDIIRHFFEILKNEDTYLGVAMDQATQLVIERKDLPPEFRQDNNITLKLDEVPPAFKKNLDIMVLYTINKIKIQDGTTNTPNTN